eukprot:153228_1
MNPMMSGMRGMSGMSGMGGMSGMSGMRGMNPMMGGMGGMGGMGMHHHPMNIMRHGMLGPDPTHGGPYTHMLSTGGIPDQDEMHGGLGSHGSNMLMSMPTFGMGAMNSVGG